MRHAISRPVVSALWAAVLMLFSLPLLAQPPKPWTQCPHVGMSPSCGVLIVINANNTITVYSDSSVGPYENSDDTLTGVQNNSSQRFYSLNLKGTTDLFGFENLGASGSDGICDPGISPRPSGCPFGSTGYEGPGVSFTNISSDYSSGTVNFNGGIPPGGSAYFGLEEAVTASQVTAPFSTTCPANTATAGQPYSSQLIGINGSGSYSWSLSQGSLSPLALSPSGLVSGTPNSAVTLNFTIQITDNGTRATATQSCSIVVSAGAGGGVTLAAGPIFTTSVPDPSNSCPINAPASANFRSADSVDTIWLALAGLTARDAVLFRFSWNGTVQPQLDWNYSGFTSGFNYVFCPSISPNGTSGSGTLGIYLNGSSTAFTTIAFTIGGGGSVTIALFNTGVQFPGILAADGSIDSHYALIGSADSLFPGPNALVGIPGFNWITNAASPVSKWISPRADGGNNSVGNYTYRTTFDLTGLNPATALITGRYAVDNSGLIKLNDNQVQPAVSDPGFLNWNAFTINSGFVAGVNTLDFVVTNTDCGSCSSNPTGLRVEFTSASASAGSGSGGGGTPSCPATTGGTAGSSFFVITATPLPSGTVGATYSQGLTATGGVTIYRGWTLIAGSLPSGISLSPGVQQGTGLLNGVPTAPGSYCFTVQVTDNAGATATKQLSLTIAGSSVSFTGNGVVNSASYASGSVAPGELVVIFGSNLGPGTLAGLQLDNQGNVATSLAGTQVLFDGVAAPMIYTLASQVSVVVPYEVSGKSSTQVQVVYHGQTSASISIPVANAIPGIFTADSSGKGQGALDNQNGSVNSPSNPAAAGSIIFLYVTGEGQTSPGGVDGKPGAAPLPTPMAQPVTATIGGVNAPVLYAGGVPGLIAGVMQVNVQVPPGVAPGSAVPIVISVGGKPTQTGVTLAIK
jgi:uncharacterized protein (TIGR03437 family)